MSGSRLKILVIAALVFINAVFLAVIISDNTADAQNERKALENVCSVMQNGGIMINPDDVRTSGVLRTMRTARSDQAEAIIARAVLGETVMTDQGVIYLYENAERGIAEFYSGCDFEIRVNAGVIPSSEGASRTVRRLLRDMRLETAELFTEGEPGGETVTAVSAYKGASIFNCAIEFVFSGGSLQTVKGRYMTGAVPAEDGAEISRAGTALLGFFAAVRNEDKEDVDCSQIYGVEAGYSHRVVGSFGEGVISPAWLITTDTGIYIMEDLSGEIRLVGQA